MVGRALDETCYNVVDMGERQASKKRGIPAGRKAIAEAELEHKKETAWLAAWVEETMQPLRPGFFDRVEALANRSAGQIPPEVLAEGERRNVCAWTLYNAILNNDMKTRDAILTSIEGADDAACEKEWGLRPGDAERWGREYPGSKPMPGQVWRWVTDRQAKEDEREDANDQKTRAAGIALRDRDLAPPSPEENEIRSFLELLRGNDWSNRENWPVVDILKENLGMTRKRILIEAKAGRWGERDVWKGAACRRKGGGRPPEKLSARAVGKVLRLFAKLHPSLSAEVEEFSDYLYSQPK